MLEDMLGGVSKLAVWKRVVKAAYDRPVDQPNEAVCITLPWPLVLVLALLFLFILWKLWI